MWVDSSKPFRLVYALCKHEFLGYLIEPHVVQLNQDNSYSLTYQRIFNATASEFADQIDSDDIKLINLLESIEQSVLIKRYHKRNIRPAVYFSSVFNETIFEIIRPEIDQVVMQTLKEIGDKPLFLMSKEGWPVSERLRISDTRCSVLFHFRRNDRELRYFPTLKHEGQRLEFMYKGAEMVCNAPACMLLEQTLYTFEENLEGKKLAPFLQKRYISIPRSAEENYLKRFVAPLLEKHSVYAEGFNIRTTKMRGTPVLRLKTFQHSPARIVLHFNYEGYKFFSPATERASVKISYDENHDVYTFLRVLRAKRWEEKCRDLLIQNGLLPFESPFMEFVVPTANDEESKDPYPAIDWLNSHLRVLREHGFEVTRTEDQSYAFGQMELEINVSEENDWFDVHAFVLFGAYKIPFIALRDHILNHQREFRLPGGEVALIPESWFARFSAMFRFSRSEQTLQLKKQHVGLLEEIRSEESSDRDIKGKINRLSAFERVEPADLPNRFNGVLRPYQKAGYDWLIFLNTYRFGGCLADDMGLGKTIQTLALLQKQKEIHHKIGITTSLIVLPTSLIYNWQEEARKFAPQLKVLNHTGGQRQKNVEAMLEFDVVLTTYGTVRVDIDFLSEIHFHYVVLDESQNIKNASSKSFKAIQRISARHKLILSGTPVENSVADLWPQMSFINPGLLGSHSFFVKNFVVPIEKKKDVDAARRLQAIIKPFILRRTKTQVASELPAKSEKVMYCEMTSSQDEYYERVKAEFRNIILEQTKEGTLKKSAIQLLQGLSRLRQLANHPKMIDSEYSGDSGKFQAVIEQLEKVLSRGHKVLIFSQFVRQMHIYREYFDRIKLEYAYLDGATSDRETVIENFRANSKVKVFLISIKAGGVGLNLTEADYVFILDPWWNPAVERQAIDRSHRIGQTKSVFIYKFITKNTVEEKIIAMQKRKRRIADSLIRVEEGIVKSLTPRDIQELVN